MEELSHILSGAKFFSKLDTKNGYWSVKLDRESQLLTTFNSPFGRCCFQRMPFGLGYVPAEDVFFVSGCVPAEDALWLRMCSSRGCVPAEDVFFVSGCVPAEDGHDNRRVY